MRVNSIENYNSRVWVDGIEVTKEYFDADDHEGWVDCIVVKDASKGCDYNGELETVRTRGFVKTEVKE